MEIDDKRWKTEDRFVERKKSSDVEMKWSWLEDLRKGDFLKINLELA